MFDKCAERYQHAFVEYLGSTCDGVFVLSSSEVECQISELSVFLY